MTKTTSFLKNKEEVARFVNQLLTELGHNISEISISRIETSDVFSINYGTATTVSSVVTATPISSDELLNTSKDTLAGTSPSEKPAAVKRSAGRKPKSV